MHQKEYESIFFFTFQLLLVTGGYDGSKRLDSTEIYRDNVWTVSGQLAHPTWVLKGITINNRVMALGILYLFIMREFIYLL